MIAKKIRKKMKILEISLIIIMLLIKSNAIASTKNSKKDNELLVDRIARYIPNNILQDGSFFLNNLFESLDSTDLECKYTCPNQSNKILNH